MSSLLGGFAGLGGGSIGKATVDLFLNTGVYQEQLAKTEAETKAATAGAGKGFAGFQSSVKSSLTGAQTAIIGFGAVAAIAIGKGIAATQQWAGEVRSLQRVTGQSAEQASALAAAGKTLGLDVTKLTQGFGLLSKNIVNNSTNLTKYGIATKDASGAVLPFDDVLGNVIDKFQTLPKGPEQAAFAMNVFGKSGKDLIPILSKGRDGLAELEDAARDAGLVMSQDDLDASKELTVAQREMGEAFKGASIAIGKAFVPIMTALVKALTTVVNVIHLIPAPLLSLGAGLLVAKAALVVFQVALNLLIARAPFLALALESIGVAASSALGPIGLLAGAFIIMTQHAGELGQAINEQFVSALQPFTDEINATKAAFDSGSISIKEAQDRLDAFGFTTEKSREIVNEFAKDTSKSLTDTGRVVTNFADLTRKEFRDWRNSIKSSIVDTFQTLGQKTTDIFNVTKRQLARDFATMVKNSQRFNRDLNQLLSLKPGTFGLSKVDLQSFQKFLLDQGPGYVDAFVNSSKAAQKTYVAEWRKNQKIVKDTIGDLPKQTTLRVNVQFNVTSVGADAALVREFANEVRAELNRQAGHNGGSTGLRQQAP